MLSLNLYKTLLSYDLDIPKLDRYFYPQDYIYHFYVCIPIL